MVTDTVVRGRAWPRYTFFEIRFEICVAAGAATLALWHFSPRYKPGDLAAFADAARAHFGGTVVVASDLLAIPVARRT